MTPPPTKPGKAQLSVQVNEDVHSRWQDQAAKVGATRVVDATEEALEVYAALDPFLLMRAKAEAVAEGVHFSVIVARCFAAGLRGDVASAPASVEGLTESIDQLRKALGAKKPRRKRGE